MQQCTLGDAPRKINVPAEVVEALDIQEHVEKVQHLMAQFVKALKEGNAAIEEHPLTQILADGIARQGGVLNGDKAMMRINNDGMVVVEIVPHHPALSPNMINTASANPCGAVSIDGEPQDTPKAESKPEADATPPPPKPQYNKGTLPSSDWLKENAQYLELDITAAMGGDLRGARRRVAEVFIKEGTRLGLDIEKMLMHPKRRDRAVEMIVDARKKRVESTDAPAKITVETEITDTPPRPAPTVRDSDYALLEAYSPEFQARVQGLTKEFRRLGLPTEMTANLSTEDAAGLLQSVIKKTSLVLIDALKSAKAGGYTLSFEDAKTLMEDEFQDSVRDLTVTDKTNQGGEDLPPLNDLDDLFNTDEEEEDENSDPTSDEEEEDENSDPLSDEEEEDENSDPLSEMDVDSILDELNI